MSKDEGTKRSVVMISQWFPPEHAPIGYMVKELATYLSQQGWEVEVITGFPNHPTGRVQPPYSKGRILRERLDGVDVSRLWLFTSERLNFLTRALNFLSFTFSVLVYLLFRTKPKLVFAVLQPLPMGAVLSLLARIRGFKLVFSIQDLHPDVLIDLGLIRNPLSIRVLKWIERTSYRRADGLAVICEGFKTHVQKSGGRGIVAVIPNWIDIDQVRPESFPDNPIRQMAGVPHDSPVALYAGTIGHVSGAEVVIEAAKLSPDVTWLFVGEGPVLQQLKRLALSCSNVRFLPFQPRQLLSAVQNSADVSLISLLPGKGAFSVPSKVLGYMAAARPVVASVDADSETARLVADARCGEVVPAGDALLLARAVRDVVGRPQHARSLGQAGRAFLEANYSLAQVCGRYQSLFEQVVS